MADIYTPRTTAPSADDKNWINVAYGGNNRCITSDTATTYGYSRGSVLPNCFTGDTEIITNLGIRRLDTLIGTKITVPTQDGTWHDATVKYFGQQPIYEVTLLNGNSYKCTANHRWVIYSQSGKTHKIVETKDLVPGNYIHYTYTGYRTYEDNYEGIRHGFVFGDGSRYTKNYTRAIVCGYKREFMLSYFEGFNRCTNSDGTIEIYRQPIYAKELPSLLDFDKTYLYNFLRGYFAADGTVASDGYATIRCAKYSILEGIRDICAVLGMRTSKVRTTWGDGFTGWRPIYDITLMRDTVHPDFFLNPKHRSNALARKCQHIRRTQVKHIKPLNITSDVYCPVEPVTHTCTLGGGELTGQCTGYAWGRFMEILGSTPTLSTGNAGDWYGYTGDGYERGQEPRLGAVACWARPGDYGHVAIVEQINSDGSIKTGNSGWGWVSPRGPVELIDGSSPGWITWSGYQFQGFIYNPGTVGLKDKLSAFLEEAEKHINEGPDWTWSVSGLSRGQPWCAAFICAVAKTVGGILGEIMMDTASAGMITKGSAEKGYGEWIQGPWYGKSSIPQPGDLVTFRYSRGGYDKSYSDHVAIVKSVNGSNFQTIEGNTGNNSNYLSKVSSNPYNATNTAIEGYFRPNWTKVGASSGNLITNNIGPLYDFTNTRKDALIRQIAYISEKGEPSISQTRILLSAMNYTTLLNSLYEAGMPSISGSDISNDAVIVDGLENNAQSVVKFIMAQGLTAAAGIGVAANIKHESGFRTDVVEYGYTLETGGGAGLCQWTNYPRTSPTGRRTNMIQWAGPDWRTNMTGQLEYLWHELTNSYTGVLNVLRSVSNNVEGAMAAAEEFLRHFEVPANMDYNVRVRRQTASELWNQIVPVLTN